MAVAWQPSPPQSGYFTALRNAPRRRRLKAQSAPVALLWERTLCATNLQSGIDEAPVAHRVRSHKGFASPQDRLLFASAFAFAFVLALALLRLLLWPCALGSWLLALGSRGPRMTAAGGWRNSPQGGRHGCRPVCRQDRMSCRQTPEPARVPSVQRTEGASSGGSFFWLLFFEQAKKSDPASGRRTEARRRRARSRRPLGITNHLFTTTARKATS